MSNKIDALLYTQIPNNLSPSNIIDSGLSSIFNPPDPANSASYYNQQLNQTTLKKLCCMNLNRLGVDQSTFQTTIRIPVPSGYNFGTNPNADIWQKFGYIEKTISVPSSVCKSIPGYDYTSDSCQKFMQLYCANMRTFYDDELSQIGGRYSDDEFSRYSPVCACYGKIPSYIKGVQNPSCIFPGCDVNNTNTFLPQSARTSCLATFCTANIDLSGAKVGGSINLNSKIQQNCGSESGVGMITNPVQYSPTSSTTESLRQTITPYFTVDKSYMGYIIIIIILILLCCSSSILIM